MKSLHEELRDLRLEKGISLEDINLKTKIRIDFLENLDQGDYSFLPMPYIRAFLMEYAQAVGIDPRQIILRLDKKTDALATSRPMEDKSGDEDAAVNDSPEPDTLTQDIDTASHDTSTPPEDEIPEQPVEVEPSLPETAEEEELTEAM